MKKLIQKNQKILMVGVGVILVIVFFLPNRSSSDRGLDRTVATIYGHEKITGDDLAQAQGEWRLLSKIELPDQRQQQMRPLPLLVLQDEQVYFELANHPDTYLLLQREARHIGLQVDNDQLQSLLKNQITDLSSLDEIEQSQVQEALSNLLLVRALLDRVASVVKISQPEIHRMLALTAQDLSLNVATVPLSRFVASTTQPSDSDIQNEYDAHKNDLPGHPQGLNELGFGYKLPDRVQLQFLTVTSRDLRQAAVASQPSFEWTTQARRMYRTHQDEFPVPTTQPTNTTSTPPAPTWEELPATVKFKVFDRVYDDAARDLGTQVTKRITDQMVGDYNSYRDAQAMSQPPLATSLGMPFNSDAYLPALAASVEKQFSVLPAVTNITDRWEIAADLRSLPGIGDAADSNGETFADVATTPGKISVWQPSTAFGSPSGDATYIFRLTAFDPSHPAPLADVRSQVAQDLRTAAAWENAKTFAEGMLKQARFHGLATAAGNLGTGVTETVTFNPSRVNNLPAGLIPGQPLQTDSLTRLAKAATTVLTEAGKGEPPVTQVELPADQLVAVVELNHTKPDFDSAVAQAEDANEISTYFREVEVQELQRHWADNQDTIARTQYKHVD